MKNVFDFNIIVDPLGVKVGKGMEWQIVHSLIDRDYGIFRVRLQDSVSPKDGNTYRFVTLEASDWVNVIPITDDGFVVMIKQFRQGTKEICLEIPGGLVEKKETPLETAMREMQEETGYSGDKITYLGSFCPNPALFNNLCHTYLVEGVRKKSEKMLEPQEDIEIELVPLQEVLSLIKNGKINYALVACAFFLFFMRNARI